jgi:magnesium-transporting ATPase (P-type)
MQVPLSWVRRKGEIQQISARPRAGDIGSLSEGDRIPADGRLIQSINLQVKSRAHRQIVPVNKDTGEIARPTCP